VRRGGKGRERKRREGKTRQDKTREEKTREEKRRVQFFLLIRMNICGTNLFYDLHNKL
jgi:hypothetical protein